MDKTLIATVRPRFPNTMLVALLVLVAILSCIEFVDRPLAELAASHSFNAHRLQKVIGLPGLLLGLALIIPVLRWMFWKSGVGWRRPAWLCSVSVLWTAAAVELLLKRVIGRSAPSRWLDHHEFTFHWFGGRTSDMQSMPSGEAALLTAVLGILWAAYPRWRWAYFLIGGAEAVGLVWFNWHFASDVLAGAAVGALGAFLALRSA